MVCDVIRNHPSDVIGLQEALRFQMDSIREDLPVYGEIGVAREDGKRTSVRSFSESSGADDFRGMARSAFFRQDIASPLCFS